MYMSVAFWWPSYLEAGIWAVFYSAVMCADVFPFPYTLTIKSQYISAMVFGAAFVHGPVVRVACACTLCTYWAVLNIAHVSGLVGN